MKRIITIFAVAATLCSCVSYTMEEVLLERSDISLTWQGELQVAYAPEQYQICFNESKLKYRVYSDTLKDWFAVSFSEMPAMEGQGITADVSWTGQNGIVKRKGLEFKVEKTDAQGFFWLWNDSDKIGIIIKNIK